MSIHRLTCIAFAMLLTHAVKAHPSQPLDQAVDQRGTVSWILEVDRTYRNGEGQEDYRQTLLDLPGLLSVEFRRTDQAVNIFWKWHRPTPEGRPIFFDIVADLGELPGPEPYHLLYTWDSALGRSEAYFNGKPLRIPGQAFDPWWAAATADRVELPGGRLKIRDLEVRPTYTPPAEALARVPADLLGHHHQLIGFTTPPRPVDVAARRGDLLYESRLDRPESVEGWVGEGPLAVSFNGTHMRMRSEDFAEHVVFWCPQEFPDRFVAEWEFRSRSRYGLAIVFFAARGEDGRDLFDPSLTPRDGQFKHYIRGDITSYHISYFANVEDFQMGRTDSNMRKNNRFYRVGGGPIAIPPGAPGWQHLRLVKDGRHIQLSANGQISIDWIDDDPDRFGPPHGGGKIGFRQMKPTIGEYRNFRVWDLPPALPHDRASAEEQAAATQD
jgi:hypothetical protein